MTQIFTVSKDGALFTWSCSKNIDDIRMRDRNNTDEDTGVCVSQTHICSL